MAPVVRELESQAGLESKVCVTAQHRHMLDQVLEMFEIRPDYDLNVMRPDQDLSDVTSSVLLGMRAVLKEFKPDIVLVQGDTTTTFAASLAAFYLQIPVGHVEAGLRTGKKYAPFPEEINRRMTTCMADLHFAPTEWARANLIREGVPQGSVFVTGNPVVDALQVVLATLDRTVADIQTRFPFICEKRRFVLITGHRRESFGDGFRNICQAIRRLAEAFPECDFVYPVHLNPNVRRPIKDILDHNRLSNVHLIEPLSYTPFVHLMSRAYMILTDSGGIQEEALSLGKPVLVMRDATERPEGVEAGAARLVGNCEETIFAECGRLLADPSSHDKMVVQRNPYGDGLASRRIVSIVQQFLRDAQTAGQRLAEPLVPPVLTVGGMKPVRFLEPVNEAPR
jgi:UDP-N-acetylglucosamine 2-epimerase